MGKIEEVTDENEEELLKERKESKKSDDEDDEGTQSQASGKDDGEDDDDDEEEIDFTKSVSKEELLGDISSYAPAELVGKDEECSECDNCDGGNDDFFDDKRSKSKATESMTSKRAVAFIVLFPMLASGGYMLYEVFGKFKLGKSSMQATAAIGGAFIAVFIMSNVKALQSAVKFVLCFAWIIFLYPTYQVYRCSPVPLKNDMLGTWFSLKTDAAKFNELSFATSECFQGYPLHSPYLLSLMNVKVSLTVDIGDLINLNVGNEEENVEIDETPMYNYFLVLSKRSVKKKFHKLHMIIEAAPKLASTLKESLKLTSGDKDKKMLRITGSVSDIDEVLFPMQKELEGYGYLIRPFKLRVHEVKYVDRYAKLKNNINEDLY